MLPHRLQPTKLPHPWDSPGRNTGVGCHFLLQSMKVKSESEVAQSCLTLSDPKDHSLPGFSTHRIFQARVLEWDAIAFSVMWHDEFLKLELNFKSILINANKFSLVQLLSCVRLFVTPWTSACQATLSITNSGSPHKPMSFVLVMPSNHLIFYHPLLLPPSIFPSIRVFSNESGGQSIGVSAST